MTTTSPARWAGRPLSGDRSPSRPIGRSPRGDRVDPNRRPRRTRDRWRISARRATRGGATITTRIGFCAEPCARTAPRFDRATRSEKRWASPSTSRSSPPPPPTPTRPEKRSRTRVLLLTEVGGVVTGAAAAVPPTLPRIGSNETEGRFARRSERRASSPAGAAGRTSRGGARGPARTRGGGGSRATRRRRWRGGRGSWRRGEGRAVSEREGDRAGGTRRRASGLLGESPTLSSTYD